MAWNTPLANPLAGLSLTATVVVGFTCAAIVAALPAGLAIWAKVHRHARRIGHGLGAENRRIEEWVEEIAPRPGDGPA